MKTGGVILFAIFVLISFSVISEENLSHYQQLRGSLTEKRLLQFVKNSIIHQFDPSIPIEKPDMQVENLPPVGIYLSLMKKSRVRACVGSFYTFDSDLLTELQRLAKEVIYKDTRSRPLSLSEMNNVSIVISFVGLLREIDNPHAIDFSKEGLFVSQGEKKAVLLPGETKTLAYGLEKIKKQLGFDFLVPTRYAAFRVVVFDERNR